MHGYGPHTDHTASPEDVMKREFWEERYSSQSGLWSGNPNPQLVTEASELVAGDALDAGCGEGADAIWLAEHGWHVTAADISTVALGRGAARAMEVGADVAGRIDWRHEDLLTWAPPEGSYDLVSAQFIHPPKDQRHGVIARLAASVRAGGSLLVVGHHPSDMQTTVPRPQVPDLFYTASELAAMLDPDSWRIIVSEARERTTTDPEGRRVSIHDTVLRAQRDR